MDNEVLEKSISRPSQIHPRRPKSFRLESFAPSTPQSAPDSPQEVQGDPLSPLQLLVTPLPEVVQTPPLLVLPTALSQIADIPTHKISVQPAPIAHVEQEKVMNTRQQKQYLALVVLWLGVNLLDRKSTRLNSSH